MGLMAVWVVLVVAIAVAVVAAVQRRTDSVTGALRVLDQRLARGDITREEHGRRHQAVIERRRSDAARWHWQVSAASVVAVIVLAVIAVSGLVRMPTWGGGGWMGGHMGWRSTTSSTADVVEGAREVRVEAGEMWFKPDSIEVAAGEPVNLQLINTGSVFHDLTVPAASAVLAAQPGQQASGAIELVEPGRYEFYCSVAGHAQAGMRGTIVVISTGPD